MTVSQIRRWLEVPKIRWFESLCTTSPRSKSHGSCHSRTIVFRFGDFENFENIHHLHVFVLIAFENVCKLQCSSDWPRPWLCQWSKAATKKATVFNNRWQFVRLTQKLSNLRFCWCFHWISVRKWSWQQNEERNNFRKWWISLNAIGLIDFLNLPIFCQFGHLLSTMLNKYWQPAETFRRAIGGRCDINTQQHMICLPNQQCTFEWDGCLKRQIANYMHEKAEIFARKLPIAFCLSIWFNWMVWFLLKCYFHSELFQQSSVNAMLMLRLCTLCVWPLRP